MAFFQKIRDLNSAIARHYSFAASVGAIGAVMAASSGVIDEQPASTLVLMGLIGFLMTGIATLWVSVDFFEADQSELQESKEVSEK